MPTIELIRDCPNGPKGRRIECPYKGWADYMVRFKFAKYVEPETQRKSRRRKTEKAVTHGNAR